MPVLAVLLTCVGGRKIRAGLRKTMLNGVPQPGGTIETLPCPVNNLPKWEGLTGLRPPKQSPNSWDSRAGGVHNRLEKGNSRTPAPLGFKTCLSTDHWAEGAENDHPVPSLDKDCPGRAPPPQTGSPMSCRHRRTATKS